MSRPVDSENDEPLHNVSDGQGIRKKDPPMSLDMQERVADGGSPHSATDQAQKERSKLLSMVGTLVSPKLRSAQSPFETVDSDTEQLPFSLHERTSSQSPKSPSAKTLENDEPLQNVSKGQEICKKDPSVDMGITGGTIIALKTRDGVVFCADGKSTISFRDRPDTVKYDEVKLYSICDEVYLGGCGIGSSCGKVAEWVRNLCEDNPPSSVGRIALLVQQKANRLLSGQRSKCSFILCGKLPHIPESQVFILSNKEHKFGEWRFDITETDLAVIGTGRRSAKKYLTCCLCHAMVNDLDNSFFIDLLRDAISEARKADSKTGGRITVIAIHDFGVHRFGSASPLSFDDVNSPYQPWKWHSYVPQGFRLFHPRPQIYF